MPSGECLRSKVRMVVWVAGKNCDPVNTCHSVALRDCLGRKNALYKYLILCFTLNFSSPNFVTEGPLSLSLYFSFTIPICGMLVLLYHKSITSVLVQYHIVGSDFGVSPCRDYFPSVEIRGRTRRSWRWIQCFSVIWHCWIKASSWLLYGLVGWLRFNSAFNTICLISRL